MKKHHQLIKLQQKLPQVFDISVFSYTFLSLTIHNFTWRPYTSCEFPLPGYVFSCMALWRRSWMPPGSGQTMFVEKMRKITSQSVIGRTLCLYIYIYLILSIYLFIYVHINIHTISTWFNSCRMLFNNCITNDLCDYSIHLIFHLVLLEVGGNFKVSSSSVYMYSPYLLTVSPLMFKLFNLLPMLHQTA